jgi:hypothetical protein
MLAAVLMVACTVAGFAGGLGSSVLVFRQTRLPLIWPGIAMAVFGTFTSLGTVVFATLTGGLGEELLGTAWGPPIGVFAGCLIGSFTLNSFFGSLGLLAWATVRLAQGQTDEEGRPRP